jgi:phosphopentomutase
MANRVENNPNRDKRAIILIVDGCGVGAAPDASTFGDLPSCNTLSNLANAVGSLKLPNFAALGLGNISTINGVEPTNHPKAIHGKLQEVSNGKDTQTGHWEMMGIVSTTAFPTYPNGFPDDIIARFIKETGVKEIYSNKPVSGTEVLEEFGELHQKTGQPIVYTSGDSVLQIAAHVETVPLQTLYKWCEIAREIMQGKHRVGRIIARPFKGSPSNYQRMSFERRDYGVKPPEPTLLDKLFAEKYGVLGIGKIEDIFDKQGLTHAIHTGSNKEGLELTLQAINNKFDLANHSIVNNAPNNVQLIFTNLVDTDALWGHRRNTDGYAKAMIEIDHYLGEIMKAMKQDDLLIITSDHGNDPTAPGTDHTREFVPLIAYAKSLQNMSMDDRQLGIRKGFVDIAASLATWFGIKYTGPGKSFVPQLTHTQVA